MNKFLIEFTCADFPGGTRHTYVGTTTGAKRETTRLYNERFCGPWMARVYGSTTGKLIASRIGLNPWRNAQ